MQQNELKRLFPGIDLNSVDTVTVDVFDTILLRDVWPEELQFIEAAQTALPYLQSMIEPSLTAYEVLTFRNYARSQLLAAMPAEDDGLPIDKEVTVSAWFTELARLLAQKYDVRLSTSKTREIVAQLIGTELAIETKHLHANDKLAAALQSLRDELGARLYFVSDMYLDTKHVEVLLAAPGLSGLFEAGITSSDGGVGKYSGKMYRYLEESGRFPGFAVARNLHIGDSAHSDYRAPIAEGSQAFHYKTRHHTARAVRERLGRRRLARYHRRNQAAIRAAASEETEPSAPAVRVGRIFAPALIRYVHTFSTRARLMPNTYFLGASSEAVVFDQAHHLLFGSRPSNLGIAPKLNRQAAMRAAVSQATELGENYALSICKLIEYGEGTSERADVLTFIGVQPSELFVRNMPEKELRAYLWRHLMALHDESIAQKVAQELGIEDHDHIVLLDVGWGGTIQVFAREFAALRGYRGRIEGLYFGVQATANRFGIERGPMEGLLFTDVLDTDSRPYFVPEIWEYVLSDKRQYSVSGRHRRIHKALLEAVDEWKHDAHAAPDAYWEALKPNVERLLAHPTIDEVELLGSIQFDSGFNRVRYVPLVDTSQRRARMWVKSILRPKMVLRQLSAQYSWTRGAIRYYRLFHLVVLYRLAGMLKHKRYI